MITNIGLWASFVKLKLNAHDFTGSRVKVPHLEQQLLDTMAEVSNNAKSKVIAPPSYPPQDHAVCLNIARWYHSVVFYCSRGNRYAWLRIACIQNFHLFGWMCNDESFFFFLSINKWSVVWSCLLCRNVSFNDFATGCSRVDVGLEII